MADDTGYSTDPPGGNSHGSGGATGRWSGDCCCYAAERYEAGYAAGHSAGFKLGALNGKLNLIIGSIFGIVGGALLALSLASVLIALKP